MIRASHLTDLTTYSYLSLCALYKRIRALLSLQVLVILNDAFKELRVHNGDGGSQR